MRRVYPIVTRKQLNFRFHNPNPEDVTTDYILKIMIEANIGKVEKILQEEMKREETDKYKSEDL